MAPKKTRNEEKTSRDVLFYKSELEDIDFALYNFLNDTLAIQTRTNKGFRKVPVIWSGSERSQNIKTSNVERDATGQVVLPVISVERKAVKKSEKSRSIPYATVDPIGDLKGGYLTINKVIQQEKTSNFANADALRRKKQLNFPLHRFKKNEKIVYETITIPIPIYVDVEYGLTLRTEYQEQMNDLMTPFIRVSNGHKRVMIQHNLNRYEAFIQENYAASNNISNYQVNERKYETAITINVFGYLIGDGKNQKQPRVVRRENPVQIRFARERVLVDGEDGEFRF
tara:strand:- start:9874 stop:10725 length:852 start_codon:yes stop_codon:yes gene_type:complete